MNEHMSPIPSRLYNAAVGGHVAGADQIIDDETGLTLDKVAGGALEEKIYISGSDNGMGRVVLRKNLVEGVNTLTQNMINKSNTIYVIQYDFTLGEDITVPANCVLKFDGGSLKNGRIVLSDNCTFIGGTHRDFGIVVGDNSQIFNCEIINSSVERLCVTGYVKNLIIQGCYFENIAEGRMVSSYVTGDINCIFLRPGNSAKSIIIRNNKFVHRRMGFEFWGDLTDSEHKIETIIIEGNTFKAWDIDLCSDTKYACWPLSIDVKINGVNTSDICENLIVRNNSFDGGLYGLELVSGMKNIYCEQNTIQNCNTAYTNSCAELSIIKNNLITRMETVTTVIKLHANNVQFRNNTILGGGVMFENKSHIFIEGNYIRQDADISYTGGTSRCFYGSNNADDIKIINNVFISNNDSYIGSVGGVKIAFQHNFCNKNAIINNVETLNSNYNINNIFEPNKMGAQDAINFLRQTSIPLGYAIYDMTFNRILTKGGTNRIFSGIGNIVGAIDNSIPTSNDNKKGFWSLHGLNKEEHYGLMFSFGNGYHNNNITQVLLTQCSVNITDGKHVVSNVSDGILKVLYRHIVYNNETWTAGDWQYAFKEGVNISPEVPLSGTFANKPAAANINIGFKYFCTDRQTAEGATDGIEIIHKGNNVWVDALGRVVS